LAGSVLLYVDEEGRLQNALVDLWALSEKARETSSAHWTRFAAAAAFLTDRLLRDVLGRRLFGFRTVLGSACLSLLSTQLTFTIYEAWQFADPGERIDFVLETRPYALVGAAAAAGALILMHQRFGRSIVPALVVASVIVLIPLNNALHVLDVQQPIEQAFGFGLVASPREAIEAPATLVCSIFSDVGALIAIRVALRRIVGALSPVKIVRGLTVLTLVPVALVILPWVLANPGNPGADGSLIPREIRSILWDVAMSNVASSGLLLFFVLLMAILVLHRLLWELIQRPIVAAHRFGLFNRRAVLASVGLLLLSAAVPGIGHSLSMLLERIHVF
jgi:uncharacterized membrane protein